jgi:uncharacterized phiE125 gp8 family phage protein
MIFRPTLVTAPAESPVTLDEVKAQVTVGFSDDDTLLTDLRDAAVAHLDGFRGVLGRAIVEQTWALSFGGWCREMLLPVPDVSAVTVKYYDESGVAQEVDSAEVRLIPVARGTVVSLSSDFSYPAVESPRVDPVFVEFTCGFGGADDVPANLKRAICALASIWYETRAVEPGETLPIGIEALVRQYRWTQV